MRFKGLDLNLLVAFDVLLEKRSVSRAAERLSLSQPATSSALARLRDFFGDDILVMHGKRMFATPYADSLLPQVRACLAAANTLIATSTGFDPVTSRRMFRLITSDYISVAVVAPLVRALAGEAPHLGFEFILPDNATVEKLDRGEVDLIVSPIQFSNENHVREVLFEERHVVVGSEDHPLFAAPITEEAVFAHGHVAVAIGAQRTTSFGDRQLELLGKPRRIDIVASSFTMVPWLLVGTQRLAVMHERLARAMAERFPIAHAPLPFDFPLMAEMMEYHPSRTGDEGLRWLRGRLRAYVEAQPSIHAMDENRSEQ